MGETWLIVGISGVTCGGKTTLANKLNKLFPESKIISQDHYFLPVEDKRHIWIPHLNHINFDILCSLDMEKMHSDLKHFISDKVTCKQRQNQIQLQIQDLEKQVLHAVSKSNVKLLVIEGFSIFNYAPIESFCQLKYFFQLDRDECYKRRIKREYDPPDCPGYFEDCVWPEYQKQLDEVQSSVENVVFFNQHSREPYKKILTDIIDFIS